MNSNSFPFTNSGLGAVQRLSRRRLLSRAIFGAVWLPLLGASALAPINLLAATDEAPETEDNMEGPFYKPNAPLRSVLIEPGMAGTPLTVTGRVLDARGRPLKGALLDFWHADQTGTYDNAGFRLRGRIHTNDEGQYTLRTIKPMHYGTPGDMRPAHIHVKAGAGNAPVLTTQLYFKGDPWNRHDSAVRPSLMMAPRRESGGLVAQFNFVLKAG